MTFIEGEVFHDKRRNLTVYETLPLIIVSSSRKDIYWKELFHDKRRNLTVYEKLRRILLAQNRDGIY
jgi:hypothetical protein